MNESESYSPYYIMYTDTYDFIHTCPFLLNLTVFKMVYYSFSLAVKTVDIDRDRITVQ